MIKLLSNVLIIFLLLSSSLLAKDTDRKLQSEYGSDLKQVPYFLRFAFSKNFNKEWSESNYVERKAFLADYDKDQAAEKAEQKADALADKEKDKERLQMKKDALLKERKRLKEDADEKKAEQQAYAENQREFKDLVHGNQSVMQQMEEQFAQSKASAENK